MALLGTNGAGKSTLLRAIGGVTEADSGAVVFDGRDITHTPPDEIARLGIGPVPGGDGVFPTLTVEENLRAAAWQAGASAAHDAEQTGQALGALRRAGRATGRPGRRPLGWPAADAGLAMALLAAPQAAS